MTRSWDAFLSPRDREVYERSGWGGRMGFGRRPVLLVVDCTYMFCGDRREPLEESMKRWPASCGESAWSAADRIAELLATARERRVPVIYTTGLPGGPLGFGAGRWSDKLQASGPPDRARLATSGTIIEPIAPTASDILIAKGKPSAFFGTPLAGYLVDLQADTVIVCGGVTSGCVRATVVDAFSLNYRVAVVEECVFDRGDTSHAINLFDMDEKYADVVGLAAAKTYLTELETGLFDAQVPGLRRLAASRAPAFAER
jgi:nicotinamidase-related amidase